MERPMTPKDVILLLLISFFWGTSFLFIKIAVQSIPPLTLVEARLFLAAAFMLIFIYGTGSRLPRFGRDWLPYLILGITNCVVPYLLITWGEIYIDSGLTAIIHASMPLFTIIMAHFITHTEQMTSGKLAGIGVGLAGVMLLIGPAALKGLGVNVWAQMAIVIASINYAWAAVYGSKLKEQPAAVLAAGQMLVAAILLAPFSLMDYPWSFQPTGNALAALVCLAIFGTAIPYIIYFKLIATVGATRSSLVTYLLPVVGVVFGAAVLQEQIRWTAIMALVLILSGAIGVNGGRSMRPAAKTNLPDV